MSQVSTAAPTVASEESPISRPALPRYITIKQAAETLDTKSWPIHERVCSGELGAIEYDGKWLVSVEDVEALDGVVPQGRALFPATPEILRALELPLRAFNEARGTEHTLESVAAACVSDFYHVDELTLADTDAMAAHVGGMYAQS